MKRISYILAAIIIAVAVGLLPATSVLATENDTSAAEESASVTEDSAASEDDSAIEYHDSSPNDYITEFFDVNAEFDTSHTATITETIGVDFIMEHHGITRNIPLAKDYSYVIKDVSVDDYPFTVEDVDNNKVIRIGDSDSYMSGKRTFVISYKIQYFSDEDKTADFLAHNLLPMEWDTSIRQSEINLVLPKDIDLDKLYVYGGAFGTDDPNAWENFFGAEWYTDGAVFYGEDLPKGCGLTVRDTELPEGYWSDAISFSEERKTPLTVVTIVSLITAALAVVMWLVFGKNEKIIETVEFYPPDDITPAELGFAIDENLEDDEMMSTVFYIADKGYITIEQQGRHFIFKKVKDMAGGIPEHIRIFFNGMFAKKDEFNTKKVPSSFRSSFDKAVTEAMKSYNNKYGEVFTLESDVAQLGCLILLIINMIVFCIALDGHFDGIYLAVFPGGISVAGMLWAWRGINNIRVKRVPGIIKIAGGSLLFLSQLIVLRVVFSYYPMGLPFFAFYASLIVIFVFSMFMRKRSKQSMEFMGKAMGFANFIKTAEYDRIKELSDEDPQYFYHILPYAVVLGQGAQWSKRFERINIPKPEWYENDAEFLFTAAWYSHMLRTCTTGSVPAPPSSGSSSGYSGGSSGGGFSGGGGGGGGGGAW